MISQWNGNGKSRGKLNTCRRPMGTKLGKEYSERLTSLKPYDPLITWHIWGHMKICGTYIFPRSKDLWPVNLAGCYLHRRRFSTQTLKSSPTDCCNFRVLSLFFSISLIFDVVYCRWQFYNYKNQFSSVVNLRLSFLMIFRVLCFNRQKTMVSACSGIMKKVALKNLQWTLGILA